MTKVRKNTNCTNENHQFYPSPLDYGEPWLGCGHAKNRLPRFRDSRHELSCQLPRNIVPIATNDAQGMLTEPKDCLFETARTFSANAYKGGMEALCRRRGDPKPPSLREGGEPSPHNECTQRRASYNVFQSMHPMQGRPSSSFFAPLRDKKRDAHG